MIYLFNNLFLMICELLAGCLIHAWAILEHVISIMWSRSVIKMLPSMRFAEDKVFTFLILHEKC